MGREIDLPYVPCAFLPTAWQWSSAAQTGSLGSLSFCENCLWTLFPKNCTYEYDMKCLIIMKILVEARE
jgi:hypothetical protein